MSVPVPYHADGQATLYRGHALDVLRALPDRSVHCCVTSPPYWGLRRYGLPPAVFGGKLGCGHLWEPQRSYKDSPARDGGEGVGFHDPETTREQRWTVSEFCATCGAWRGELGLEPSPDLYVAHLVEVFREVRRVLRDDGTCWLVLGDSYSGSWGNYVAPGSTSAKALDKRRKDRYGTFRPPMAARDGRFGLKPKDLVGVPWMVAFALRDDGWWLRSEVIWHKPNGMPGSQKDRPTIAHEHLFLLAKSRRYFYDEFAVREPLTSGPSDLRKMVEGRERLGGKSLTNGDLRNAASMRSNIGRKRGVGDPGGRTRRSVWTVATVPFKGAHFATFPPALVRPCILAGTSDYGCCAACGAPYERVTEGGLTAHDGETATAYENGMAANRLALLRQAARERGGEYVNERRTVGWRPTCSCAAPAVPCIVLDPFLGSGTVAKVARELGRRVVGIELGERYVEMAVRRLRQTVLDWARAQDGRGAVENFGMAGIRDTAAEPSPEASAWDELDRMGGTS